MSKTQAPDPVDGETTRLRQALKFYADGDHFTRHRPEWWDTVSGEPQNFYEDEAGTATVEDGSVAKAALEDAELQDENGLPIAAAFNALRELVACKDMKERAEALHFAGPLSELGEGWKAEYDRLRAEYIRRQPAAWEVARDLLKSPSAVQAPAVAHSNDRWTVISPAGEIFTGESPFRAASAANKHWVKTDPEAAKRFAAALESIRAENEAENARLAAEHGTLDCPACGGSGHVGDIKTAASDVLAERHRQIKVEGWTPDHDDEHDGGDMAAAASAYALAAADKLNPLSQGDACFDESPPPMWMWDREWWKPGEPRRMLVKAGALILAEIERIDRASDVSVQHKEQP